MRTAALVTLATALSLAACHRGPEEKLPDDNSAEVGNVAVAPDNVTVAPPAAANTTNATTAKAAPTPGFTDDQQMKDDADATGMTARLPDDEKGTPAANQTAPAK